MNPVPARAGLASAFMAMLTVTAQACAQAPELRFWLSVKPAYTADEPLTVRWHLRNAGTRVLAVFSHVETDGSEHFDPIVLTLVSEPSGRATSVQLMGARKAAAFVHCALQPGRVLTRRVDLSEWMVHAKTAIVPGRYTLAATWTASDDVPAALAPCSEPRAAPIAASPWAGRLEAAPVRFERR